MTKRWKPKIGDVYYFLTGELRNLYLWEQARCACQKCRLNLKAGNCYRTRKEALAALKRVKKALKGEG